jgi:hypothetical protein
MKANSLPNWLIMYGITWHAPKRLNSRQCQQCYSSSQHWPDTPGISSPVFTMKANEQPDNYFKTSTCRLMSKEMSEHATEIESKDISYNNWQL